MEQTIFSTLKCILKLFFSNWFGIIYVRHLSLNWLRRRSQSSRRHVTQHLLKRNEVHEDCVLWRQGQQRWKHLMYRDFIVMPIRTNWDTFRENYKLSNIKLVISLHKISQHPWKKRDDNHYVHTQTFSRLTVQVLRSPEDFQDLQTKTCGVSSAMASLPELR